VIGLTMIELLKEELSERIFKRQFIQDALARLEEDLEEIEEKILLLQRDIRDEQDKLVEDLDKIKVR